MNTRILSISILIVAVILLGVVYLRPQEESTVVREVAISEEAVAVDPQQDDTTIPSQAITSLPQYTQDSLKEAQLNGKTVLFFHADWCPFCRAAEKDIVSKYEQIPTDVTILKVDYDSEKELRKQYGVTTQHTFVQIDSDGDEVTKWVGAETLEDILSRLE